MNALLTALLAAVAACAPLGAFAQSDHAAHHGSAAAASPGSPAPMTDGVVKRIDKAGGSITIAHDELKNLGMPKMTMTFQVKNTAWLDAVKEDSKIRFSAENVKGTLTVVALAPAK